VTQVPSVDTSKPAAEWVEVDALLPWVKNPRKNDAVVDKIAASIREYGFGAPLIVRRANGEVIGGHTRLKAAIKLGMTHVPARYLDLSETQAHALALADNKLGEMAEWNETMLAVVLNELAVDGTAGLLPTGFSNEELLSLMATPEVVTGEPGDRAGVVSPPVGGVQLGQQMSHVKMEQLFFDQAGFDEYNALVKRLAEAYGTRNKTDTTLEALRRAVAAPK
jgi:ParB-like nuclease domain